MSTLNSSGETPEFNSEFNWQCQPKADQLIRSLGSHLEILERNDGFKGFNQTGVSEIILKTDPRKIEI